MSTGREERLPGRRAGQVSAISLESLYAALGFKCMIPSALQRSRGRCDVIVARASKGALAGAHKNVHPLSGGLEGWRRAGFPVEPVTRAPSVPGTA